MMWQADWKHEVGTTNDSTRERDSCCIRRGRAVHQMIAVARPNTTARLYFWRSLQANDGRSGRGVPAVDRRTIEPGGLVFDSNPVARPERGYPEHGYPSRAGCAGSPGRPPGYHSPPRSYINDARRSVALEDRK